MQPHTENIHIQGLRTGYKSKKEERVVSYQLDLSVLKGELVMLMGPNGCGKSTLMHTLAGLLPSLGGYVQIAGKDMALLRMREKAQMLSLVLTDKITTNNLTVWDIVVIGRYPYIDYRGKLSKEDDRIVREALTSCKLSGFEKRLFCELSDGEKQRVMIARALAQQTPVMLLDEPTAHLDLPSRLEVIIMLRNLARQTNKSILVSTHEMDLALQWADTVWLMNKQGTIYSGCPEDLILNGKFKEVFGNETLDFDMENGTFTVKQKNAIPIMVEGKNPFYKWTLNALHRNGFIETANPNEKRKIIVNKDSWTIYEDTLDHSPLAFKSIRHLLNYLHSREETSST